MKKKTLIFILIAVVMPISSCSPAPAQTSQASGPAASGAAPTITSSQAPVPLPAVKLTPGDFYFSADGKQSFIFSRNMDASWEREEFMDFVMSGGSSIIRVHLNGGLVMGYNLTGETKEEWAAGWDKVFDEAEKHGINVIPVFSDWTNWVDGSGTFSGWWANGFNSGYTEGSKNSPEMLFDENSHMRAAWIEYIKNLVGRWKNRDNIIGWEVFSEVDRAAGATEQPGVDLVNDAAKAIRSIDPGRPITASISDMVTWHAFYRDADIDFIDIHIYPPSALDRAVVKRVRDCIDEYKKPVLIGESGFFGNPQDYPEGNVTGDRHAAWAEAVSGAMNGRALYWEDGFAQLYCSSLGIRMKLGVYGIPWMDKYSAVELPASEFVKGVDYTGFAPLECSSTESVWGAAAGSESSILGWFRDSSCEPPDYTLQPVISGQSVTVTVPGNTANWKVDFYSTADGTTLLGSVNVIRSGETITIPLPDFNDDIAFKAHAE